MREMLVAKRNGQTDRIGNKEGHRKARSARRAKIVMARFVRRMEQTVLEKADSEECHESRQRPPRESSRVRWRRDRQQCKQCDPHKTDDDKKADGAAMQRNPVRFRQKGRRDDELTHTSLERTVVRNQDVGG
jgi:hypothetical protein